MPRINLPQKKKRSDYPTYTIKSKRDNENHKIYNSNAWRELRLNYLMKNPLCEMCLKQDRITSAIDVHHKYEISNGKNLQEKQNIGYDVNNLMAVCKECHYQIHNPK